MWPPQNIGLVICFMISLSSCFVVAFGQTVNSRARDILKHYNKKKNPVMRLILLKLFTVTCAK